MTTGICVGEREIEGKKERRKSTSPTASCHNGESYLYMHLKMELRYGSALSEKNHVDQQKIHGTLGNVFLKLNQCRIKKQLKLKKNC